MHINASSKNKQNWQNLVKQYNREKEPISFDFKSEILKTLANTRLNNYTHYIHYYPGRIFPYIPLFIFSSEELCPHDGLVLDPFSGGGTVLLESIINPKYKRNALGVEINPLGRLISKVKTTPLKIEFAKEMLGQVYDYYENMPNKIDLFIPNFKNRALWFSEKATSKLSKLRYSIEELVVSRDYKDLFWVCFSSIIRKVSKADPYIPPPVILKIYKYKNSFQKYNRLTNFLKIAEDPDVLSIFKSVVEKNLKGIDCISHIEEINKKEISAKIIWDDAREIRSSKLVERGKIIKNKNVPRLDSKSIDLIVTSPPYLTAQKYIRTHKLELFWLDILKEQELIELDRNSIGTENVSIHKIDFEKRIGVKSVDSLINWSEGVSLERAALVYKYFEDMKKAISEMHRILKKDGYAVLVVGSNTVLKRKVDTYRLLADLATSVGFEEVLVLKDDIKGRGMITKRHNSGGLIKDEYVIVLKKGIS
jgi:hypothetical protein